LASLGRHFRFAWPLHRYGDVRPTAHRPLTLTSCARSSAPLLCRPRPRPSFSVRRLVCSNSGLVLVFTFNAACWSGQVPLVATLGCLPRSLHSWSCTMQLFTTRSRLLRLWFRVDPSCALSVLIGCRVRFSRRSAIPSAHAAARSSSLVLYVVPHLVASSDALW